MKKIKYELRVYLKNQLPLVYHSNNSEFIHKLAMRNTKHKYFDSLKISEYDPVTLDWKEKWYLEKHEVSVDMSTPELYTSKNVTIKKVK